MAFVSPRMSLKVWNSPSDPYDHEQLADNFLKLDIHDHSQGRGAKIGAAGIQNGAITNIHLASNAITAANIQDGTITTAKFAPAADASGLWGSPRVVGQGMATLPAATAGGTYALDTYNPSVSTSYSDKVGSPFYFPWADFVIAGRTPMLKLRGSVASVTAQPITFSIQFNRVTQWNPVVGALATATVAVNSPTALSATNPPGQAVSAEVAAPTTNDWYMFTVITGGATVTNPTAVRATLYLRYV